MKKFNTSTSFKRKMHTESASASLQIGKTDDSGVFDIDNYEIVDLPLDGTEGAVHRVGAICKLPGYEKERFDWVAAQADLDLFGEGDADKWRQYVAASFAAVLAERKEQWIKKWTNPPEKH